MKKDEILNELIKQKIIRKTYDEYFIIKKRAATKTTGICKNLPKKYSGVAMTVAMNFFFDDAEIPAFHKGTSMEFALHTMDDKSRKVFYDILCNSSIDFSILVSKTHKYYSSPKAVKKGIGNYFTTGLWKTVYDSYEESAADTGNTFFG